MQFVFIYATLHNLCRVKNSHNYLNTEAEILQSPNTGPKQSEGENGHDGLSKPSYQTMGFVQEDAGTDENTGGVFVNHRKARALKHAVMP